MANTWSPDKIAQFADQTAEAGLHNRDQAIAWRRWALASCLSINGGASIAVMNLETEHIGTEAQFWAILWFIAGIAMSILYGFGSAWMMSRWGGFYVRSSWTMRKRALDPADNELEKLDIDNFDRLLRTDARIQWLRYPSMVFFLIGLSVALAGLK